MKVILINVTEDIINLSDIGLYLQPNTNTNIDTLTTNVQNSKILLRLISEEKVVINDMSRNLLPSEGIRLIVTGDQYPLDSEGKLYVHQSSRVTGTMTYWTGRGDKPNDVTDVGNGEQFTISNFPGDPDITYTYIDFNTINNTTSLHEGYFIWEGAKMGDYITLESVVNTVTVEPGTNTNYNLYGGFMVVPAAGDGTINVTSDITNPCISGGSFVEAYTDETGYKPPAFWNADFNTTTNRFENITPAPLADGQWNMYTVELVGNRFVNSIPVLGSGFEMLQSSDSTYFPHGIRIKATIKTSTDDHEWHFGGILTLHREKTA